MGALLGAATALAAVAGGIGALVLLRGAPPEPASVAGWDPVAPAVVTPPDVAPDAPAADAPANPTPAPPALGPPPSAATPPRPALTVLNNSRIPSLAATAAARYEAGGWPVAVVGRFRGRIVATTVYYAAGQRAQARAVAAAFGVPRVLPRFAGLPGSGLTVVVTRDLA